MGLALQYLEDREIEMLPSYTKSIVESVRIPPNLPLLDGKLHFSDPEAKPMELLELLQTFQKFECRDPRDKVDALAGLSAPHSKKKVIDYSKELSQRLEIICTHEKSGCNCPQGSHDKPSSIPTWVPNWSCIQAGTALRPGLLRGPTAYQLDRWNASGDTSASTHISDDGSVLKCKDVLLGTITHIVRPVTDYEPQDFHNILQLICSPTTQDINSLDQGALLIALRETLLKTAYIDEPASRDLLPPTFMKIYQLFLTQFPALHKRGMELVYTLCHYLKMAMEDRYFYTDMTGEKRGGQRLLGVTFMFSREDDVLAVLYGCRWPVLLRRRKREEGDGFVVLGEVYVHEFMNVEALELGEGEGTFDIY